MLHQAKIGGPRWREMVEHNLCVRWKQRREMHEQIEEPDGEQFLQDIAAEHIRKSHDQEYGKSEEQKKDTERQYTDIAVDSNNGTLLLPSVAIPSEKQPFSYVASVISNIEQQSLLQEARNDRNKAMIEAKCYRDLAETLKKEKRELENRLQTQIEVVRDFWRNKIFEGGSRGGKFLRASLLRK